MSLDYDRTNKIANPAARRAVVVIFALLVCAGWVWHRIKPGVIEVTARTSLGHDSRSLLLREAIENRFPDRRASNWVSNPLLVRSCASDPFRYLAWWSDAMVLEARDSGVRTYLYTLNVANRYFEFEGKLRTRSEGLAACGDFDGDGAVEVANPWSGPGTINAVKNSEVYYVARLGKNTNTIVGLFGLHPVSPPGQCYPILDFQSRSGRAYPFLSWQFVNRVGGWRKIAVRRDPIVSFEWTEPGGILQLGSMALSANSDEIFCLPIDDLPIEVPVDADLEGVVELLLQDRIQLP